MRSSIRIVAGEFGGRRLSVPERGTRPMADRVRQSLFAVLEPQLRDAVVLDLCAGSGAAGLEALSRGAAHVTFVERSRPAADAIDANIASLGVADRCSLIVGDAVDALTSSRVLRSGGDRSAIEPGYSLVIVDPPYDDATLRNRILDRLGARESNVARGALVVATSRRRGSGVLEEPHGRLRLARAMPFGETLVEILMVAEEGE